MKKNIKLMIVLLCVVPTLSFGQISLGKSDLCSSLRVTIPPEKNYENGYVLNLELKKSDNSWVKMRRVRLESTLSYSFENVPDGEYRVSFFKNSKYEDPKLKLSDISSNPVLLECRGRDFNYQNLIHVHPNPTSSLLNIEIRKELELTYEIMDYTGKRVMQGELKNSQIDVSSLIAGMFFINILNSKVIIGGGKFIKNKN
jgi:hypothetical protein